MKSFWEKLEKPFFILAPMEDVTGVVFRHVVAKAARPDVFFSEFTNVSSFCSPEGKHSTRSRLAFTPDEQPIVAQIWGNKPQQFEEMSRELVKMGFSGIDINMGCPDKAVVKNGSGSALIKNPELAVEIIRATKCGAGKLPVSVKTRLGYSKIDEYKDWLRLILAEDIANLSVHLRTKKEMSKISAHFELIEDIKKIRDEVASDTLLTINGDILSRKQGEELAKKHGIDGIMIGRGVFQNPFVFERNQNENHSKEDLLDLLRTHLNLFDKYSKELGPSKFEPLKRFFKIYVRDFNGASELRDQLMHTKSTDEAREVLNSIK